jgi:quinolinate synthase
MLDLEQEDMMSLKQKDCSMNHMFSVKKAKRAKKLTGDICKLVYFVLSISLILVLLISYTP